MFAGRARESVGAAAKRREKWLFAETAPGKSLLRHVQDAVKLHG